MKAIALLRYFKTKKGTTYKMMCRVNEAIKELEELENRSCDNCKYNKEQDNFMIFCDAVACQDGSRMMWHSFTKDFCCNKWEAKNENL